MNDLMNFSFDGSPIRTVLRDGEPWFVAKDVASLLGYANPQEAVRTHCKGVSKFLTPSNGGDQEISFIAERDLYRLIMRSKKPEAERFEEWVVGEVLPSIRKTGSYATPNKQNQSVNDHAISLIQQELKVCDIFGVPLHIAQIEAVKYAENQTGVDYSRMLALAPAQNNIREDEKMLEPSEIGKLVKMSGRRINEMLGMLGLQDKVNGVWVPNETAKSISAPHAWKKKSKSGYNVKWAKQAVLKLLINAQKG